MVLLKEKIRSWLKAFSEKLLPSTGVYEPKLTGVLFSKAAYCYQLTKYYELAIKGK